MRDTSKDKKFFIHVDMHREAVISVMAPDEETAMGKAREVADEAVRHTCTFCHSMNFQDSATPAEEQRYIDLTRDIYFRYPQRAKWIISNPDEFKPICTQEEWDIYEEAAKLPNNY